MRFFCGNPFFHYFPVFIKDLKFCPFHFLFICDISFCNFYNCRLIFNLFCKGNHLQLRILIDCVKRPCFFCFQIPRCCFQLFHHIFSIRRVKIRDVMHTSPQIVHCTLCIAFFISDNQFVVIRFCSRPCSRT